MLLVGIKLKLLVVTYDGTIPDETKHIQESYEVDICSIDKIGDIGVLKFDRILIFTRDFEVTEKCEKLLVAYGVNPDKIYRYSTLVKEPAVIPEEEFWKYNSHYKYDRFIFGMSHAYGGIIEKILPGKTYKFAAPSMDLFYHYKVLQHLEESYDLDTVKEIVFEMPYYVFNYDISRCPTVFDQRMNFYYYLEDYHHYGDSEQEHRRIDEFEQTNLMFMPPIYNRYSTTRNEHGRKCEKCKLYYKLRYLLKNKKPHIWTDEEIARIESLNPHVWEKIREETISENVQIWAQIKKILVKHNIKIKVCVFPFCGYFIRSKKNGIEKMKKIFYDNLGLGSEDIWDEFETYRDNYELFDDECHLNEKGSYQFTKYFAKLL